MNIAIVTTEFVSEKNFDGGLANYTFRLAKSLKAFGHKPVVIIRAEKTEKTEYEGIEVYRFEMEHYEEWLYRSKFFCKPYTLFKRLVLRKTEWLDKLARKFDYQLQSYHYGQWIKKLQTEMKFDIVHYSHLGGIGYFRLKDIPCVARISSSTSLCQQFGGYGASDRAIRQQEKLEFKTMRKMDGVFGPSRMIASIIEKEIGRKIEIIETPFVEESVSLDPSLYEKNLSGKDYLLFFGTIGLIKGVGTIAEIIYELLNQNPALHFVFVGKKQHSPDPGKDMIAYLQYKAKEHSGKIIHFDKIPHIQLYPIIEHANFCVLPSRIDNFPNTCIEAMAHSKIVIGTLGNGFEQLIDNGASGFLIRVDDHQQLLETINKTLALSPEEKNRIEQNALKRVDMLKPEKVILQLIEFYTKTIKNFKN
jgi:glycogen(starch) synthase